MKEIILLHQESSRLQEAKFITGNNTDGLFHNHSFCIFMNPSDNYIQTFLLDPYIKIGDGNTYHASRGISRIALINPRFIDHRNRDGKGRVDLTKELLSCLNDAMRYQCHYDKYHGAVLECINMFLRDTAESRGLRWNPIPSVDFTLVSNFKRRHGDNKIC
jgi:hypothetical protein